MESVNDLLVDQLNAECVYLNRTPKDFERPSYLIEAISNELGSVNCRTVKQTVYLTITCFAVVDAFGNSDDGVLVNLQDGVLNLFRKGYLKVADRALEVQASTGGADFDRSYVDLQLEFYDDRSDETDTAPLMKEIEWNLKEE
ncbi:hypothetical protein FL966_05875 [Caproiciproducens galactitolivorans]|nr:hypothetical protein FL966_05875 [Caproiciproducens galactitolivorans]